MKFSTLIPFAAAFVGLVASVPVPGAESSEIEARSTTTIYPNLIVKIMSPNKGEVSSSAEIGRYTTGGMQYDTNSLLAYPIPDGLSGKTCSFSFQGGQADGTRKVQLFSVGGPITASNTYTSRPYRDNSYGIFTIAADGTGKWDNIPTPTFACPSWATTLGFEVVPEGDYDWAKWGPGTGLAITAW